MKVQVTFSAETPADIKKLITTLNAFSSGVAIEAEIAESDNEEIEPAPPEEGKKRKPKEAKVKPEKAKEKEAEFDFEEDFSDDDPAAAPAKIDLAAIRTLVNEKAADHAASIRSVMGSFNVTKLGDLKPAQYGTFYKAIHNLK